MSRRLREAATLLPTAGMEICRLGVLAGLFFVIPENTPPPMAALSPSLLASLVLTRFFRRIRRRRITEFLASGAGFLYALCRILRSAPDLPFAAASGLPGWWAALGGFREMADSYHFFMLTAWSLAFWLRGFFIGRSPVDHPVTSVRFDGGLGILFFVFFIRMAVNVPDPRGLPLTVAYFLFGILALYLSKSLHRDAAFSASRSALGVLPPVIAGFLILGAAFHILYPVFARSAVGLYRTLRSGAAPLGPWIVRILRFLFGFGFARVSEGAMGPPAGGEALIPELREPGPLASLLEKILTWTVFGVLGLVALGLAGWVLYRLFRRLAARADGDGGLPGLGEFLARWFRGLLKALGSLVSGAGRFLGRILPRRKTAGRGEGAEGFAELCRWGRLSGLGRRKSETPGEYGGRLARNFPAAGEDILLLARLAEEEFYGERELPPGLRSRGRRARRGLRNPALLPARLAARFRPRP